MAIPISKYVNITSGIGGATIVPTRELIGRLFTTNNLLPTQMYLEFTSAAAVGAYFGLTSEEYLRAAFYFAWISKSISSPQKISFGRWTNAAVAPMIFGQNLIAAGSTLSALQAVTNGSFTLTLGGFTFDVSGLNFSSDLTLAAVAAAIQAAIQAESGGGALWTSATVTYDSVRGSFDLVGGATGVAVVSVAAGGVGQDISAVIGWFTQAVTANVGAIWSNGNAAETLTQTLTLSASLSNNFGSFLFLTSLNLDLTQYQEIAIWNTGKNISFLFMIPVPNLTAATTYAGTLMGYLGLTVTVSPTGLSPAQYPEMLPMMILAATNYFGRNTVQNYFYQMAPGLTPSVTDLSISEQYDALGVNYYGQTQQAGALLAFYQNGILMGPSLTQPQTITVYANEIWLRDNMGAAILGLQLVLNEIAANSQGIAQLLAIAQPVINQALRNGTISTGNVLSQLQILYINEESGTDTAWYQVQTIGYWINFVIVATVVDSITVYTAEYTLIYKKDDTINSVNGTHILI